MAVQETSNREIRECMAGLEFRAAKEGSTSPGTIVGYAAVFERYSLDLGYFREKIKPGAFTNALKRCDVRAVVNHVPSDVIGRMSAGTLQLTEDEIGLRAEITLPDTTVGRDVAVNVRDRNIQGQSFMFTTSVDEWNWAGEVPIRTVVEVDELYEVGPVTFPAYEETSVALRCYRDHEAENLATPPDVPEEVPPVALEGECVATRLRLLDVF